MHIFQIFISAHLTFRTFLSTHSHPDWLIVFCVVLNKLHSKPSPCVLFTDQDLWASFLLNLITFPKFLSLYWYFFTASNDATLSARALILPLFRGGDQRRWSARIWFYWWGSRYINFLLIEWWCHWHAFHRRRRRNKSISPSGIDWTFILILSPLNFPLIPVALRYQLLLLLMVSGSQVDKCLSNNLFS